MTNEERTELIRLQKLQAEDAVNSIADATTLAAAKAWDAVKRSDDALWIDLPSDIKYRLVSLSEKALAGRSETPKLAPRVSTEQVQSNDPPVLDGSRIDKEKILKAETEFQGTFTGTERRAGADRRVGEFPYPDRREGLFDRRGAYPLADPAFISSVAERNPILQGKDVASGDPIVDLDSRSPMEPRGLNHLLSSGRVLRGNTTEKEPRESNRTASGFSDDTSSHAPNDNVVQTDPNGSPVIDTKGQAPPVEVPALSVSPSPEFNAETFNAELRNQAYRYPPLAQDANETE